MRIFSTRIALAAVLSGFLCAGATASHGGHLSHSRLDVDIEDLDADIRWDGQKWSFRVEYDVEIENVAPGEAFDLVLNVIDRTGRVQPIQIVVPLVTPSEIDDDELEYESSVIARFDPTLVSDPKKLRVRAEVVPRGGGVVLDHEETSVKYRH
jgi:hypothetical protein